MTKRNILLVALALASIAIAAGCGGGNNGPLVPVPTSTASSVPAPQSTTFSLSSSTTTVASVTAGIATASITFPAVTGASGTVTVAGSGSLPGGVAPLSRTRNGTLRRLTSAGPPTFVAYVSLTATASFTLPSSPAFSFSESIPTGAGALTNSQYYIAYMAPGTSTWVEPALGPATTSVSGNTLTLAFPAGQQSVSITAGQTYSFALYFVPTGTYATPSPSSSPTASPSSSASPSSNPSTSPTSSASPTIYSFGGSTDSVTFTQGTTPIPASLASYHSVGVTVQFAAPTTSGTLNFSDALNGAQGVTDVTPSGLPVDNATSGYTPIIYISAVNTGSTDVNFGTAIPQITLADTSLNGTYTTCEFDVYGSQGNGTSPTWFTTGTTGTVSSSGVVVGPGTLGGGNTVDFKTGQQIIAISCH